MIAEIESSLSRHLSQAEIGRPEHDPKFLAHAVFNDLFRIEAPVDQRDTLSAPSVQRSELIKIEPLGGAVSIKPGNLRLRLGEVLTDILQGIIIGVAADLNPTVVILVALDVCQKVWGSAKVPIEPRDALVLLELWKDQDERYVRADNVLENVNHRLRNERLNPQTSESLLGSLRRLEQLRCVKRSEADHDGWWLVEELQEEFI